MRSGKAPGRTESHAKGHLPESPPPPDRSRTFPPGNFSPSCRGVGRGRSRVRRLAEDPGEFLAGRSRRIRTGVCTPRPRLFPPAVSAGFGKTGPVRACTGVHALPAKTGSRLSLLFFSVLLGHPSPTPLVFPPLAHSLGTERVASLEDFSVYRAKQETKPKLVIFDLSWSKEVGSLPLRSARETFKRNPSPPSLSSGWFPSVHIPHTGCQSGF